MGSIERKNRAELASMREAGRIVAEALDILENAARPGVSLNELERLADEHMKKRGAKSAFLHYGQPPYPKVLCASVNDVVVHGIPDARRLEEGDIVGLDFGVVYQGFYGDGARTVGVGKVGASQQRLMDVTKQALDRAIAKLSERDVRVGDIGHTIQSFIEGEGYSIVRDFVGHGIGRRMHEEPQVPNYGPGGNLARVRTGMVLAIEPMVNEGTWEVDLMDDQWTVRTRDRKLSAHFEHTIAITENGPEVFTRP